jgi:predicted PurR-regulated permease PerM
MESKTIVSGRTGSLVAAASVIILFAGCKTLAPILSPVLLSLLLALMIRPLVDWLARRRLPRVVTILVTLAGVVGLGFAVISWSGLAGRLARQCRFIKRDSTPSRRPECPSCGRVDISTS